MLRRLAAVVIASLVLPLSVAPAGAQGEEPVAEPAPTISVEAAPLSPPDMISARLDTFAAGVFEAMMPSHNIPGAVFVAVRRGEVISSRGFGFADVAARRPVDPDETRFRVASVTKLFTAIAAMQLVEQDRLDLRADLNTYPTGVVMEPVFEAPVTLFNLLTHTGGFDDSFLSSVSDVGAAAPSLREQLSRRMPPRVLPPGTTISYSNYGFALAGLLVETVSGEAYADYVTRHILAPLGMTRSHIGVGDPADAALALPYVPGAPGMLAAKPYDVSHVPPAGEMVTTGGDMAMFMRALLANDGTLLTPDTLSSMMKLHFANSHGLDGYGLGFAVSTHNGVRMAGHGGSWRGFCTELVLMPQLQTAYFFSVNTDCNGRFMSGVQKALNDFLAPPSTVEPPPAAARPMPDVPVYGIYFANRRIRGDFLRLGAAMDALNVSPGENGAVLVSRTGGDTLVYEPGTDGHFHNARYDRTLAFYTEPVTGAVRLSVGAWAYDHVSDAEDFGFHTLLMGVAGFIFAATLLFTLCVAPLGRRFYGWQDANLAWPRRAVPVAASLAGVMFLGLSLTALAALDPFELFKRVPLVITLAAWLVPVLLLLALGTAMTAAMPGARPRLMARVHLALVALSALAVAGFAVYWNLTPLGI
ncbi:MAG TPA: serine hydrolase domain-containing protein [Micropepsaceae bacterium]|nr:serine hydrolase domain-containing protein [Micropepsaceae bacterium]